MSDYRLTQTGVSITTEHGSVEISTLDAILLLSLLNHDRRKLEDRVFPAGEGIPSRSDEEFMLLRVRTEKLLERAKALAARRDSMISTRIHLAACPHCGHLHDSRLIDQCKLNPLCNSILRLPWPMRCGISGCGKWAHDAISVPDRRELGAWVVRPLCHDCAGYPDRWKQWLDAPADNRDDDDPFVLCSRSGDPFQGGAV